MSCATLTLSACQYVGLRVSTSCWGLKLLYTNGPVPTPPSLVNLSGSATLDQMCSGTIWTLATMVKTSAAGALVVKTTVSSAVASTEAMAFHTPPLSNAGYFLSRLKVKATSLAENAVPSENVTPLRVVTFMCSWSVQLYAVPSHGVASQLYPLTTNSGSNVKLPVNADGEYGL